MAKLVLSLQGKVLSEFPLNKEHVSIGRRPDNDIHIDNLAVSGRHAVVHTLFNQSFLEDLNSTNGTFVNGERVSKQALKGGDVLLIGNYELTFSSDAPIAQEEDDPLDRTVMIRSPFAAAPAAPAPEAPAPVAEQATVTGAKVAILNGPHKGREFAFNKEVTTFGKRGVQVAAVTVKPDGYYISHVEGASTATVNGEFIGNRTVRLKEYDVLEVAGTKMTFLIA